MQRVWLVKAGDDAEQIDPMRHAGLIGISEPEVGDLSMLTAAEIEQMLIDAHRRSPGQLRALLQSFAHEIKPGDLVITPNPKRHEVWLSRVSGDYRFEPEPRVAAHAHVRTVDWLGWLDRDAPWMSDQLKAIEQPGILTELYNREWWWRQYDTRTLSVVPRTILPGTKASKPGGSRSRTVGPPKARQPRPSTSTRPKPVAMLLCGGHCGLQWAPQVLVGGLCPDCRGD